MIMDLRRKPQQCWRWAAEGPAGHTVMLGWSSLFAVPVAKGSAGTTVLQRDGAVCPNVT